MNEQTYLEIAVIDGRLVVRLCIETTETVPFYEMAYLHTAYTPAYVLPSWIIAI